MTGLAQLLAEPTWLLGRVKAKVSGPLALSRAVTALGRTAGQRDIEATAAVQARLAELTRTGGIASISRRDLREGCKLFLHQPSPPGREANVGDVLIDEVDRLKRRAAFFALIDSYLDAFASDDADLARLGRRLGELTNDWPWRDSDQWARRAKTYALFDPSEAPARLSAAILASDEPPRFALNDAGLDTDGRRRGGLAEAAFRLGCRFCANQRGPSAIPSQLKLLEWSGARSGAYAFPRAWSDFAGALFLPWEADAPPADHRTLLIDAALSYAGDPRIQETRWRPVRQASEEAYDVIVRWLTKASVEQFFEIVSESMTDRPDMWAERRKFWTSYLKADLISAAWVAFGSDGARRADRAASQSGDASLSMFGRLASGGGRTSEHAALIMRIGDLTIVEWSHNGSWNIWTRNDPNHPQLFRQNARRWSDYEPQELMHAPTRGPHMRHWRMRVADIIRRETGLRP